MALMVDRKGTLGQPLLPAFARIRRVALEALDMGGEPALPGGDQTPRDGHHRWSRDRFLLNRLGRLRRGRRDFRLRRRHFFRWWWWLRLRLLLLNRCWRQIGKLEQHDRHVNAEVEGFGGLAQDKDDRAMGEQHHDEAGCPAQDFLTPLRNIFRHILSEGAQGEVSGSSPTSATFR